LSGRKLDPSEHAAATIVAGLVNGRDEPRDIDEAPEGTHDFDIDIPDGCRIALEVTAPTIRTSAASTKLGSGTIGRGRGLRTTGGWSSGMRPEGPQVRMVKVMNRIVPTLLVLEQNLVEDVDTRVRPAYLRPLPDTRQDVLDAMTNLHELGVSAARQWGHYGVPRRSCSWASAPIRTSYVQGHSLVLADADERDQRKAYPHRIIRPSRPNRR